jgi:radical SAM superfamily enzyme YgiQ (UPF0313 family)
MKRGRLLLINPRMCRPHSVRLPLSVLALGAALENHYDYEIVDGNLESDAASCALAALNREPHALVGVTVMPGPQVAPAIEISAAIRAVHPRTPIAWGGYFPTLYPSAAINAPYVDYVVRGQGEQTFLDLLARLPNPDAAAHSEIRGLTWKLDGSVVHNPERGFTRSDEFPLLPYERLGDVSRYLRPSFMGSRTAVHQCAIGCRYHCTFCGVVSMFNGHTQMEGAARLEASLSRLCGGYGANSIQFYDHNFFDTEDASIPILEVLARRQLPWWCYARADTLAGFSTKAWELLRRSRFTMAYIGAEAASDEVLKRMRKGARVEHTLEVARLCRTYGVIPEFSFVLGGPEDPEGEIERTLSFIKRIKNVNPECEVILYFYSLTPQRHPAWRKADAARFPIPILKTYGPDGPELPTTPEEWTQPEWLNYVCHQDAPWLSPKMRQRVKDFGKVLYCRFPTVQDYATPAWGKRLLQAAAEWRYSTARYGNPWELDLLRRFIPLREPQRDSL